ncbi:MAG: hypothetical protein O4861_19250 [Trichodesmium sp. St16_bin4-tuft]|nr:hypothetical protein [Trichodesmium sp. St4_bin8_1]MDE5072694.1 hypothetical protein [Trichodesmium sp. St5_bin8]MDE5100346.1 hypothetical protein [Trichodesmium sp. St16_bin4-tuft]MDE5102449.1 hypothetical protein [Trichodesmium sp. St19_bin2]
MNKGTHSPILMIIYSTKKIISVRSRADQNQLKQEIKKILKLVPTPNQNNIAINGTFSPIN